jgi:hypothetical protein
MITFRADVDQNAGQFDGVLAISAETPVIGDIQSHAEPIALARLDIVYQAQQPVAFDGHSFLFFPGRRRWRGAHGLCRGLLRETSQTLGNSLSLLPPKWT